MCLVQLCLLASALAAAASEIDGGADQTSLIQQSVGSHSHALEEQSPFGGLGDMLKSLKLPDAPAPDGAQASPPSSGFSPFPGFGGPQGMLPLPTSGMPMGGMPGGGAFKPPTVEDIAKAINVVKDVLRNETLVNLMMEAMETFRSVLKNSTLSLDERYKHLGSELINLKLHKDVVRTTVAFVEGEVDAFEADVRKLVRTAVKLVKSMPLGNQSRQIKLMATMVEPLLMQGMTTLKKSTASTLEAMGNNTEKEFCKGTMQVVVNASSSLDALRNAHDQVTQMVAGLPALEQSPLMFMLPGLVPKMMKLGKGMLDVNEATIDHYEAQAVLLNTTLRSALEEKLDCVKLLKSGSSRVSVGMVAVVVSAVAWLRLL